MADEQDTYGGVSHFFDREEKLYAELMAGEERKLRNPKISWYEPVNPTELTEDVVIISGSANPLFADEFADHLGFQKTGEEDSIHKNHEVRIRIGVNLRDMKVIAVNSPHGPFVDRHYQELCGIGTTARNHWAKDRGACAVITNFAYGRQERESFDEREAPYAHMMLQRLFREGIHSGMVMDIHSDAVAGAFEGPFQRLHGAYFLSQFIKMYLPDLKPVVVAPDAGGQKRARHFKDYLGAELLINADKFRVETGANSGTIHVTDINGEIDGCDCVVPDDIASTGETLDEVARSLKERGARSVIAAATHGELIRSGRARMARSPYIDHLFVTDTLPQYEQLIRIMGMDDKIHVAHLAGVFAEAMKITLAGKKRTMKELYQMPIETFNLVRPHA